MIKEFAGLSGASRPLGRAEKLRRIKHLDIPFRARSGNPCCFPKYPPPIFHLLFRPRMDWPGFIIYNLNLKSSFCCNLFTLQQCCNFTAHLFLISVLFKRVTTILCSLKESLRWTEAIIECLLCQIDLWYLILQRNLLLEKSIVWV
jgi:hypothetical protein